MQANIAQCEILRNPQITQSGMASNCAGRNHSSMERKGLKAARKRARLTQEVVAERMGVSVPQVSRWETGKDGIPSQRLSALVQAYQATLDELFEGTDAVFDGPPESNARVVKYEGAADVSLSRDIPVYGTSLGAPQDFDGEAIEQTMLNTGDVIEHLPRPTILNGQKGAYGLYVQGSSMAPRHEDGDTIFVQDSRTGRPPRIGDDVVLYLVDTKDEGGQRASAVLVKRLVRRNTDFVELEQFTPAIKFKIEAKMILRIDRVFPWRELLS